MDVGGMGSCWSAAVCDTHTHRTHRPHMSPSHTTRITHHVTPYTQERFAPKPDEDRLTELETLRSYLEQASKV